MTSRLRCTSALLLAGVGMGALSVCWSAPGRAQVTDVTPSAAGNGGPGQFPGDGDNGTNGPTVTVPPPAPAGNVSYGAISNGGRGGNGGTFIPILLIPIGAGGDGGNGGNGGAVTVTNTGSISTAANGDAGIGLIGRSNGGQGGNGGTGVLATDNADGGTGGNGGTVVVNANAGSIIVTTGTSAFGILAQSEGGSGGTGGNFVNVFGDGGDGGRGGQGGSATATNAGSVTTNGNFSTGMLVRSAGGVAGNGGDSFGLAPGGGNGGAATIGGTATGTNSGSITTHGDFAAGMVVQSVGGGGGGGGGAFGVFAGGGAGKAGNDGGDAIATNTGTIKSSGASAIGLLVESIGGGGGDGAGAGGLVAVGGNAAGGGKGGTVTLNLGGFIHTGIDGSGDGSHGVLAQSVGGGGGNGGFGVGVVTVGGDGGTGGKGGTVMVLQEGTGPTITTNGQLAIGVIAQSVGGGGGNGGSAISGAPAVAIAIGGKGGAGGDGGTVTYNVGQASITTSGQDSAGLLVQSVGGGGGNGGWAIAVSGAASIGVGGAGAAAGNAGTVSVTAGGTITTHGERSVGLIAQSIGGGGGNGGGSISAGLGVNVSVGAKGGAGGDGNTVTVVNGAKIDTHGTQSHALFAQSVGGGGGSGSFAVALGVAPAVAVGGNGGGAGIGQTVKVQNTGALSTDKDLSIGLFAQSVGGGGGDGGAATAGGTTAAVGVGGNGGGGGNGGEVLVTNVANITTKGMLAHGILAQSVGGGGGSGGSATAVAVGLAAVGVGSGGDAGGGGGGQHVNVDHTGDIHVKGAGSRGIIAQSVGGGGGNGGSAFAGAFSASLWPAASVGVAVGGKGGAGGVGGNVEVKASGNIIADGTELTSGGVVVQSIGGGGGNGGRATTIAGGISTSVSVNVGVSVGGGGANGGNGGIVNANLVSGSIVTKGDLSAGLVAQSVGGRGGSGGDAWSAAGGASGTVTVSATVTVGGEGGGGGSGGKVDVTNAMAITTGGHQSSAIVAQSIGGGGGSGGTASGATASVPIASVNVQADVSVGGSGGTGNIGGAVTVTNTGNLTTAGAFSSGIYAQSIGGGGGFGGSSDARAFDVGGSSDVSVTANVAVGGKGGSGNHGGAVTVSNSGIISTTGYGASGIVAMSVGGGGGGAGSAAVASATVGSLGDDSGTTKVSVGAAIAVGGGGAGNGGLVKVSNSSSILTEGESAFGISASSIGGGGGVGGAASSGTSGQYAIGGSVAGGGGGSGNGGDVEVKNLAGASIHTKGVNAIGVFAQSVGGGGGAGGAGISTGGGSSVDVTFALGGKGGGAGNGGTVTVDNFGGVVTENALSHGIMAQSIGGAGGQGGAAGTTTGEADTLALSFTLGGEGSGGGAGGIVTVTNAASGTILTKGDAAYGIFAQSVGGSGGAGGGGSTTSSGDTTVTLAIGGSGGTGNNGGNVKVDNSGSIETWGQLSHGIFAQSIGGGGGAATGATNASSSDLSIGGGLSLGGAGGANGGQVDVINSGSIVTKGNGALGIFAQSVGGGGGFGGSVTGSGTGSTAINLSLGGHGGRGGDGGKVTVNVSGTIETFGERAHGVVAQSVGGGGGLGGDASGKDGQGAGASVAFGGAGGDGGNGGDVTVIRTGTITLHGRDSIAIIAQSVGGGGGIGGAGFGRFDVNETTGQVNAGPFSGATGAKGSGGVVTIIQEGAVTATGDRSHGIVAQAVGGGGGAGGSLAAGGSGAGSGGGIGDAAAVGVTAKSSVTVLGASSYGVFGQSATGLGKSSNVTLVAQSSVIASGVDSVAVYGQSTAQGTKGNIDITLDKLALGTNVVWGGSGTGVGVMFVGGANNTLTNHNIVSAFSDLAVTGTLGNDHIVNVNAPIAVGGNPVADVATIIGNINMGAGANSLLNQNVNGLAKIKSHDFIILGDGNPYENRGIQSVFDIGKQGLTTLTGSYTQTGTGQYITDVDLNSQKVDRLNLTDSAANTNTASFAGTGPLNFLSIDKLFDRYVLSRAPDGMTNNAFQPTFRPTVGFDFEATVENGTDLVLFANKPTFLSLAQNPASGTTDPNVWSMASYFDKIEGCCGVDNPMARLINMLRFLPDEATLGTVLNRLTPHYAAHTVDVTNRATEALTDQHRNCERNPSAIYNDRNCLWFSASPILRYEKDGGGTATSRDDRLLTVSLGGQRAIDANWTLGASIGMADVRSRISTTEQKLSDQFGTFYNANLFVKYDYGPWSADLIVGGGVGSFRGSRDTRVPRVESIPCDGCAPILLPGIGDKVDFKQQMAAYGGSSRIGYTFNYAPFYAQPQVQMNAWWYRMDGFTETGSLAAMTFPSATNFNFSVVPALEIGASALLGQGYKLKSYVRGGVEFSTRDAWEVAAHFSALPTDTGLLVLRDKIDSPRWLVDTGMSYITPNGSGLTLGYRGAFADHATQHQVFGKAEVRF